MRGVNPGFVKIALLSVLLVPGCWVFASAAATNDAGVSFEDDYGEIEAVLETSKGQIVIDFFHKEAPRHVEYFVRQAREGAYDGTTFHRLLADGLIQGGDPLTRSAAARARWGTGGLNAGIPDEVNRHKHVGGAVSAVLAEDRASSSGVKAGSSGAQFFIVVAPQEKLDGTFTVFGRVVEGMDVAAEISNAPATAGSFMARERIEIRRVTIREKTPSVAQMKNMTVTIETTLGSMKFKLHPESAPQSTRNFVRYARTGLYNGATFFRVSQNYFLEVGYLGDWPQDSPNRKRFFSLWPMPAESSDVKHVRGTLSMRRAQDGTTSWYFFITSLDNPGLDGSHVPIGLIAEGQDVMDRIAQAEVDGDKPKERIEIVKVTVEQDAGGAQ